MESTKENYPFLAGNLFNPNEPAKNVHRVNGLIDQDIEWLQTRVRKHCFTMRAGIGIQIQRIIFAESFFLTIERATEEEAGSILEQIHDVEGPNRTHFWFDFEEGPDNDDSPSSSEPSSPKEGVPVLAV